MVIPAAIQTITTKQQPLFALSTVVQILGMDNRQVFGRPHNFGRQENSAQSGMVYQSPGLGCGNGRSFLGDRRPSSDRQPRGISSRPQRGCFVCGEPGCHSSIGVIGVDAGNAVTPSTGPPMSQLSACPTTGDITVGTFSTVHMTPKYQKRQTGSSMVT